MEPATGTEYDPTDIAKQVLLKEAQTEENVFKRQVEIDDLKWLMGHVQGRRIVWRLLRQYGVFRSSFSQNPIEMAFLEGKRNDGIKLYADILEHAPERHAEMINEDRKKWQTKSQQSKTPQAQPRR